MTCQKEKNIKVGDLVRLKYNPSSKVYIVIEETASGGYVHLDGLHPNQVISRENIEVVSKCLKPA